MKKKLIEPKIKNLVVLINQVPYVKTISSCQGHFLASELDEEEPKRPAHILFEIPEKKEKDFENFAYYLLSRTSPYWSEFLVELNKRYYCLSDKKKLYHQWNLKIVPSGPIRCPPSEKRALTDKAINLLENILGDYLENGNQ